MSFVDRLHTGRRRRRPAREPQSDRPVDTLVPRLFCAVGVACELPRSAMWQLWSAFLRAEDPFVVGLRVDILIQSRKDTPLTDFLLRQGSPQRFILVLERLVTEGRLTRQLTTRFQERLLALVDRHGHWATVPLHTPDGAEHGTL